jgi:hypothetical protein
MGLLDSRLNSLPNSVSLSTAHLMSNLPSQMNNMGMNMGMGNLPASLPFSQQANLPLSSGYSGFAKPSGGFAPSSSSAREVMEDISIDEGWK